MLSNRKYFNCKLKTQFYSKLISYDFPSLTLKDDLSMHNICVHHYFQRECKKHDHDFLELAYIADGDVLHILNDEKTTLRPGDYFFINYGDIHDYKILSSDTADIINCCFLPVFLNPSMAECRDFSELLETHPFSFFPSMLNGNPSNHVFHDDDGKIRELLEEMITEYNSLELRNAEIIKQNLIKIIILSMRKICKHDESNIAKSAIVSDAILYIEENLLSPDLSISVISANFGISRQYISRLFKKSTGLTFTQYIKKRKINQSCYLLCTSDDSISEIIEKTGYNDPKSFYRDFKEQTGLTPLKFKQVHKI